MIGLVETMRMTADGLRLRSDAAPETGRSRWPQAGRVDLYDVSGKLVGTYPGNRVGEGLSPAVYFVKSCERGESLRAVKVR